MTLKEVAVDGTEKVIELGFVPAMFKIVNRDNSISIEWNKNLPAGNFYKITAAGARSLVTSGGPTLVDGTDKSSNVTSSFGVILPAALADINDAAETLDVAVFRDDI